MRKDVLVINPDQQQAVLPAGFEVIGYDEPTIEWVFPSASPYHTTNSAVSPSLRTTRTNVASATFDNDKGYVNFSTPNEIYGVISGINPTTITFRNVRIAPGGVVNTITVTLRDAAGDILETGTRQVIRILPLEFGSFYLPDAVTNVAYGNGGWPLRGIGGQPPYTWSVVSGALPSGFSLSGAGILSGTHAGTGSFAFTVRCTDARGVAVEQGLTLTVTAAPSEGPHDYFDALVARADHFHSNSLRSAALVASVRNNPHTPTAITYEYATDPERRKQDACKMVTVEGRMGPGQQLRLPAGPSSGSNVLITLDFWFGSEFHTNHSQVADWKGTPLHVIAKKIGLFVGGRVNFINAIRNMQTLPAGGPFTMLTYGQLVGKTSVVKPPWSMGSYLPTNVPTNQARNYPETIAPVDDSVVAGGQELGIVGDRWHRI